MKVQLQAAEIRNLKQQQIHDRQQQSTVLSDLGQELRAALKKLETKDKLSLNVDPMLSKLLGKALG